MIDYDATLQKFFNEVLKWLEKMRIKVKDKKQLAQIEQTIINVKTVAKNPQKYADKDTLYRDNPLDWEFLDAHMNPIVSQVYHRVMLSLPDLLSESSFMREEAQQNLLKSLEVVKYQNSTNLFKDITYNLISPSRYAVKVDVQKQH